MTAIDRKLKRIELRLVAELMKNSRKSDRELAKILGISQPTVTRIRNKLEREGVIREYTAIPDFSKLGYEILAIILALSKPLDKNQAEKARKILLEDAKDKGFEFIMVERGIGSGFDGVIVSLHRDYTSFQQLMTWLRRLNFLEVEKTQFFLVDLNETVRYRPLTLSAIAKHIEQQAEK